jgi:hypothetical protein
VSGSGVAAAVVRGPRPATYTLHLSRHVCLARGCAHRPPLREASSRSGSTCGGRISHGPPCERSGVGRGTGIADGIALGAADVGDGGLGLRGGAAAHEAAGTSASDGDGGATRCSAGCSSASSSSGSGAGSGANSGSGSGSGSGCRPAATACDSSASCAGAGVAVCGSGGSASGGGRARRAPWTAGVVGWCGATPNVDGKVGGSGGG